MNKFIATLALLVVTGAVSAQPDEIHGCLPPPPRQDFIRKTIRVEIKGQLTYVPEVWTRDPMFPMPICVFPGISLITVNGKMYQLDLEGTKDLPLLAAKLSGKRVIITGILNGNNVRVADLRADEESVKETMDVEAIGQNDVMTCTPPLVTIRVEINGTLTFLPGRSRHRPELAMSIIGFPGVSQISANGKTFQLDLSGNKDLPFLAGKLNGQRVIVTGVLRGNVVHVADLRADEEYVKETTEVEARGQLQPIRFTIGDAYDDPGITVIIGWNLIVDGKTYALNLTPEMRLVAETLNGNIVNVSGILNKDAINVKSLQIAM